MKTSTRHPFTPTQPTRSRHGRRALITFAATTAATALVLTGCSSGNDANSNGSSSSSSAGGAATSKVNVVASTSIWGDVAKTTLSDQANIDSIIQGDASDPHSFEPAAADMAKAEKADFIVAGGGGYDAWLYSAVDKNKVIHALPLTEHDHDHEHGDGDHKDGDHHDGDHKETGHPDASAMKDADHADHAEGHDEHGEPVNEHVWYSAEAVSHVAHELADRAKQKDPNSKADAKAVDDKLNPIKEKLEKLPEARVAQTEPIADYIVGDSKLKEVTPSGYRHSTLSESEPTAADVAEFEKLINEGGLDVLIYNPQTKTDLTERIRKAAEAKGVKVVEISETPAKDEDYFAFFSGAVDRLTQGVQAAKK